VRIRMIGWRLHEMIAGRRAFAGQSAVETVASILMAQRPPLKNAGERFQVWPWPFAERRTVSDIRPCSNHRSWKSPRPTIYVDRFYLN
jgi:hypothetical protein